MTLGSVFIAGAVLGCIAMFALWMMLGGFTLARRRRLARRQQVRDAVAEREALAAENARLEREVARARTTRANADTAAARAYPTEPAPAVEASAAEEEAAVGGRRGLWRR
jgi:cell division protein FtsB